MHRWEFYVTVPNNFLAVNSISLKVQENNSVWQTQVLPPLSNLSVHQWVEQSLSWWQLGDLCGACLFVFNWCAHSGCSVTVYDYMPKGVQEKRTEVLENKVDGMWVSNAFSDEHMWSHPPVNREVSAALHSWEIWPAMWYVTICWTFHITTSPYNCAAKLAANCKIPAELTRCDPHEYYQMNCCCCVSHRIECYAWVVAMDNI